MDERRAADMPPQQMERTDLDDRQPAGDGPSTADLAGTAGSSAERGSRAADEELQDQPAPAPEAAETATTERREATDAAPAMTAADASVPMGEPGTAPLFSQDEAQRFRSRWQDVQASFVDEPRRAVEQADSLVAEVMKQLAQGFADERGKLESQWGSGESTETEELRLALRRYRSFFDRLLSV